MTGCAGFIVIRAWRISCQWSGVNNSFSFSKYCLEYLFVDEVFTKDSLQAPLHVFHKSFPDSGHVRCALRVEHPLTTSLLQLSSHFLFVSLFNSLYKFPISPIDPLSERGSFTCPLRLRNLIRTKMKLSVSRDLATSRWTAREFIHTKMAPHLFYATFPLPLFT